MKTFKRMALLSLAVLATAFAFANGDSKEPRVKKSRKAKKELVAIKDIKKDSLANTFEHFALKGYGVKAKAERFIIAKGDTVRFKVVFTPSLVVKIEAENGSQTTANDLKKGEWIVTLKPEKTKWCSIKVFTEHGSISEVGSRIIVVSPEEYDEVMANLDKLKGDKRTKYIDKIAGGDFNDFFPKLTIENSRWK